MSYMIRATEKHNSRGSHAHIHTIFPGTRRHIAGFPAQAAFHTGFPSEARRWATQSHIPQTQRCGPGERLTWQMQAAGAGERAGAARTAGRSTLQQEAVVGSAEQLVLPQRELVSREQLAAAHGASEALDVVHAVPRPHHQVTAAEAHLALGTLDAEQPAGPGTAGVSAGTRAQDAQPCPSSPRGPNPGSSRLT